MKFKIEMFYYYYGEIEVMPHTSLEKIYCSRRAAEKDMHKIKFRNNTAYSVSEYFKDRSTGWRFTIKEI